MKSWENDDGLLRALYPKMPSSKIAQVMGRSEPSVRNRASKLGLKKDPEYMKQRPGLFEAGHESWNKGTNYIAGGRNPEARFQKGMQAWNKGVRMDTCKPIGTERISNDGYLERKISNAGGGRWRAVHLLTWEAANGPLPESHLVVFKDGNRQNIKTNNLECISRSELMLRNSVHNLPPEIAATTRLIGALNRQIKNRDTGETV